jgi:hypothetical protein
VSDTVGQLASGIHLTSKEISSIENHQNILQARAYLDGALLQKPLSCIADSKGLLLLH